MVGRWVSDVVVVVGVLVPLPLLWVGVFILESLMMVVTASMVSDDNE